MAFDRRNPQQLQQDQQPQHVGYIMQQPYFVPPTSAQVNITVVQMKTGTEFAKVCLSESACENGKFVFEVCL